MKSLVEECWSDNPSHRPSAVHVAAVLNHLFVNPESILKVYCNTFDSMLAEVIDEDQFEEHANSDDDSDEEEELGKNDEEDDLQYMPRSVISFMLSTNKTSSKSKKPVRASKVVPQTRQDYSIWDRRYSTLEKGLSLDDPTPSAAPQVITQPPEQSTTSSDSTKGGPTSALGSLSKWLSFSKSPSKKT